MISSRARATALCRPASAPLSRRSTPRCSRVRCWGGIRRASSTDRNEAATSVFLLNYEPLVARRERREPISYILGTREFWGLDFEVTPDVLIPRHETEFIVEEALGAARRERLPSAYHRCRHGQRRAWRLSLAREFPGARVDRHRRLAPMRSASPGETRHAMAWLTASRSSKPASSTASRRRPTSSSRTPRMCRRCRSLALTPEVRDYEPACRRVRLATMGWTGCAACWRSAVARLAPGGWLVVEFGYGQDELGRSRSSTASPRYRRREDSRRSSGHSPHGRRQRSRVT